MMPMKFLMVFLLFLLPLYGCAGSVNTAYHQGATLSGVNIYEGFCLQPAHKEGSLSIKLKAGWNAVTFSLASPCPFTSAIMTFNGETRVIKDAAPTWTQSTIRYLKGRAWVILQTNSSTASFQPAGKYYIYSAFNGVTLNFGKPFIQSLSPESGAPGTEVVINGINFSDAGSVTFYNGKAASIDSWSDTRVTCIVPAGTETGEIFLVTGGVESNRKLFSLPAVIHVKTDGDDGNDGSSWELAVRTIQRGIDLARNGDQVLVADGTYAGAGNININPGGKNIHLKSAGGAQSCIVDIGNTQNTAFSLSSGETNACIIDGFTIRGCQEVNFNAAILLTNANPIIQNCIITENVSPTQGGGGGCGPGLMMDVGTDGTKVINCTFSKNVSGNWYGGAIFCYETSPTFINCTILGNSAYRGGAIEAYSNSGEPASNPILVNCTIEGNLPSNNALTTYSDSTLRLYNCIVWNNSISTSALATVEYCDVQGGWSGTGNLNIDPLFMDLSNPDFNLRNYRLQPGSPCINTGSNGLVPAGITTDRDGNPRIINLIVDMGAYEKQ